MANTDIIDTIDLHVSIDSSVGGYLRLQGEPRLSIGRHASEHALACSS